MGSFFCGRETPSVFRPKDLEMRLVVHGDAFSDLGWELALDRFLNKAVSGTRPSSEGDWAQTSRNGVRAGYDMRLTSGSPK